MHCPTWISKARALLIKPQFWQVFHAVQAVKWVLLFPPGLLLWRESVPFLMYVSLDTALTGSLAAYGAALGARKADPEDPF
jgi:hypothetical protein